MEAPFPPPAKWTLPSPSRSLLTVDRDVDGLADATSDAVVRGAQVHALRPLRHRRDEEGAVGELVVCQRELTAG